MMADSKLFSQFWCRFGNVVLLWPLTHRGRGDRMQSCSVCGRPAGLYQFRKTGSTVDWCSVCRWHWRHPMARKLVAFRLLEKMPVPSGVPELVLSNFVGEDLQRFKESAWYYCWY